VPLPLSAIPFRGRTGTSLEWVATIRSPGYFLSTLLASFPRRPQESLLASNRTSPVSCIGDRFLSGILRPKASNTPLLPPHSLIRANILFGFSGKPSGVLLSIDPFSSLSKLNCRLSCFSYRKVFLQSGTFIPYRFPKVLSSLNFEGCFLQKISGVLTSTEPDQPAGMPVASS